MNSPKPIGCGEVPTFCSYRISTLPAYIKNDFRYFLFGFPCLSVSFGSPVFLVRLFRCFFDSVIFFPSFTTKITRNGAADDARKTSDEKDEKSRDRTLKETRSEQIYFRFFWISSLQWGWPKARLTRLTSQDIPFLIFATSAAKKPAQNKYWQGITM